MSFNFLFLQTDPWCTLEYSNCLSEISILIYFKRKASRRVFSLVILAAFCLCLFCGWPKGYTINFHLSLNECFIKSMCLVCIAFGGIFRNVLIYICNIYKYTFGKFQSTRHIPVCSLPDVLKNLRSICSLKDWSFLLSLFSIQCRARRGHYWKMEMWENPKTWYTHACTYPTFHNKAYRFWVYYRASPCTADLQQKVGTFAKMISVYKEMCQSLCAKTTKMSSPSTESSLEP